MHQDQVDAAKPFPAVLKRVVKWLEERELGTKYKYTFLTDGWVSLFGSHFSKACWNPDIFFPALCRAWDMSKFLNIQCRVSQIRYPRFARKWINIRKSYGNFYKV